MSDACSPASAIALLIASHAIDSVVRFEGRMWGVSPTPTMQYLSVRVPIALLGSSWTRPYARNAGGQPLHEGRIHLERLFPALGNGLRQRTIRCRKSRQGAMRGAMPSARALARRLAKEYGREDSLSSRPPVV